MAVKGLTQTHTRTHRQTLNTLRVLYIYMQTYHPDVVGDVLRGGMK